jgi:hypothetical protein
MCLLPVTLHRVLLHDAHDAHDTHWPCHIPSSGYLLLDPNKPEKTQVRVLLLISVSAIPLAFPFRPRPFSHGRSIPQQHNDAMDLVIGNLVDKL